MSPRRTGAEPGLANGGKPHYLFRPLNAVEDHAARGPYHVSALASFGFRVKDIKRTPPREIRLQTAKHLQ